MKVIIAGSRNIHDYDEICKAIKVSCFLIEEVVSGDAPGVDSLGIRYALERPSLSIKHFPADWDDLKAEGAIIKINKYGKKYNARAGFDRNQRMANYADALIAVMPKGGTPGTKDMIARAEKGGLMVYVHEIEEKLNV